MLGGHLGIVIFQSHRGLWLGYFSRDGNGGGAEDSSVYFSGAQQSVSENQIRVLFEQLGHVSGLRLVPNRSRPLVDGYVDFSDA